MQPMEEFYRVATITLRGMWNHRRVGLFVAWVVGVLAFAGVALTPERYEASARIFVNTDSILKPLMTGLTVLPNDDQRIVMLSRIVISRPNVDRLIREVGLDANVSSAQERELLIDNVIKRLQLKAVGRENLYTLSFRDENPQRAKRAIELLAAMFMDQGRGGKSADTEAAKRFIDEQIKVYEQKLREAEERLKDFRTQNLGMAPGQGTQDFFGRMAETERVLNQSRLELREAERAREAYRAGLQGAERATAAGSTDGLAALADINSRIETMRKSLDQLLQKFTEDHPDVQGARRVLEELEAQRRTLAAARAAAPAAAVPAAPGGPIAAEQLRVSLAQAEASVASLSARVSEYSARYDKLRASATLVPKLEAELAQLNRDYEVNKKNYESLVGRRESAQMSGDMQTVTGVADFRMIDPPRVTPRPVMPNHALLMALALGGSLAAGLAAAYVARELRPSFYDARALRDASGLPLLGVVSLNLSEEARRAQRRGSLRFAGGVGALVASYAAGFIALKVVMKGLA
jgi:polysaccharide chain length determinant protein (PEP-CTERM system associated)